LHKKKYKPYKDPEMKEVKLVVAISLIAFVIGGFILASPEINIMLPEFNLLPLAYAEIQTRGIDYLDTDNEDGTHTFTAMPTWMLNETSGNYQPYLLTDNSTMYEIKTAMGTIVFHKTGCNAIFYNSTGQIILDSESTIVHQKDLTTNSTWQYITDVNNAVCTNTLFENTTNNSITIESNKTVTNLAAFSTKYTKHDGGGFKVFLSVTNNNPAWTNNTMGFIETIHVPDTITMNGTDWHIPSYNGTWFDHTYFNQTSFLPIKLGNDISYLIDNGLTNLWGMTMLYENGTSKVSFDYSFNDIATPIGQAYEIDPVFVSGGNQRSTVDFDNDNVCEDTGSSSYIDAGLALIWSSGELAFGSAVDCFRGSLRVDISSIPNTILSVDNVVYKIAKTPAITFLRTSQTHNFYGMVSDPNVLSLAAHFDAIDDGTFLASQLINTNDNDVDLGATADSELFTILTTDSREWYAIGQRQVTINAGLETGYTAGTGTLTITYTAADLPPQKPLNVIATQNRDNKIIINWSANNASLVTGYSIFSANDFIGPFTLLDTVGNVTTFSHTGLIDNFEQYYKISAFFNPNGTNSTIVYGTSGNPFVNDTSIIKEQLMFVGDDSVGFNVINPQQAGTGTSCPTVTGPSSATAGTSSPDLVHFDTVDVQGCKMASFTMDRETTNQFLMPQFFEDFLISNDYLLDLQTAGDTSFNTRCRYFALSELGIDPRLNLTAAYEAIQGRVEVTSSGAFTACISSNSQSPQMSFRGPAEYQASMLLNSSYWSYGLNVEADERAVGTFDESLTGENFFRYGFNNPTFSKIWNIQEHPKYDDNSLIAAQARINSLGKFNLNTNSDLTDRGQIIMFKEFNKTQQQSIDPNIRVTGAMQADTTTADMHLRFEIKDGGYAMGSDLFFPQNQFDIYQNGGSLGVVHLNPQGTGVEAFDISMIPNWSNSTEDIFTLFVGIDDNSTSGGLNVNVTSIEIQNSLQQNFEDLGYVQFYEVSSSTNADRGESFGSATRGLEARNFYNQGIVLAEQIPIISFSDDFDTNDWNVTGTRITINTTSQEIDVDGTRDGTNQKISFDLGSPISESDWTLRFKLTLDTATIPTGSNISWHIGITDQPQSSDSTAAHDLLMSEFVSTTGGLQFYRVKAINNGGFTTGTSTQMAEIPTNSSTLFHELKRNSSTQGELCLYPDATFDVAIECNTVVMSASTTNLQYIFVSNSITGTSTSGDLNGIIDDIQFFNAITPSDLTVGVTLPIPATPTSANAVNASTSAINLFWQQNLLNTTDFQISRESPIGNGFVKIAETNNVTLAYFDTGLAQGTEFNYEICAINGESIETTCVTASATTNQSPADPPSLISSVTATAQIADVLVEWVHDQVNTTDYFIDRGTFPVSTANLKLNDRFDTSTSPNNIHPVSELTNSEHCGVATCNYNLPTISLGTTQIQGDVFSGIVDTSTRWGVSSLAAAALNATLVSDWNFLNNDDWSIGWWMIHSAENGFSTFLTTINDASDGSGTVGVGNFDDRDGMSIVFNDDTQVMRVFTMENNFTNSLNETSPALFIEEDAAFHHYFITHDRGNEIKWYKDAVLIETDIGIATSTGIADIGVMVGNCWLAGNCSNGFDSTTTFGSIEFPTRLDQLLIFNRVVDSTEVSTIYNSGSGISFNGTFTNLVATTLINQSLANVSADEQIFIDDLLNVNGSKWQFREQRINSSPSVVATCAFANSGTAIKISSSIGNSECFVFKTFPRILLNNSKVQVNFEYTHTGTPSGLVNELVFNTQDSPNALNRDDKGPPLWPLDTSPPWSATEIDELFPPITITNGLGFFNTGRFTEFKDMLTTDTEADTDYTSIRIRYQDSNGLSQSGSLFIYWINITDATNGNTRAFYNFSSSTITSESETCANVSGDGGGPRCIRGTIETSVFTVNQTAIQSIALADEFLDLNVPRATTFQYRVTPFNDPPTQSRVNGTGVLSNPVLTNDVPAQVLNLIASYLNKNQVQTDWDDTTDLGEGSPASPALTLVEYRIYDQNLSTPPFIQTGTSVVSNFLDAEIFPQEKEYKVSACNELGCGTNSTIAQALAFPLSVPVLTASENVKLGVNSTWTMAEQTGITGYTLFNSTDNILFNILATTVNGTLFFFDTPHPVCFESFYKVSPFTATQNGTNSTADFGTVDCVFSPVFTTPPTIENIGDTYKLFGSGTFSGGNLTRIALFENGTLTDQNSTLINFTTGPTQTLNFDYLFWERETVGGVRNFTVAVSGQSPIFRIDTLGSSVFAISEYDPKHRDAIVEEQGQVNFTHFRFADENEISLRVNRIQVPSGETWQIECIYQTVNEAIDTKDSIVPEEPTVRWIGTFDNATDVGFFNSTFLGASGQHIYISCFNDLLLFSTTSFTNSSLALFGIEALDTSFGSLIGIPSGIFMLVLMAGMANKRTSPTWIVVVTGAAGLMSVIGFFTLEPIVWGLALITAMLGMFVNQKVF